MLTLKPEGVTVTLQLYLGSCQPVQAGTCAAAGSTEFNTEHEKPASDTEEAFRAGIDGNVEMH